MEYSKLFNVINVANWIISTSISIIAPFFPPFAESHGLNSTIIGLIFSSHPLGGIIASIYIGKILTNQNRMSLIMLSLLLECIVMMIFVIQYYVNGYVFLIITALIARFVNGFAFSMLVTAFYSMIPSLFPEEKEQKIAAAETAQASGFVLGPLVGSLLYQFGGYTMPFIVQMISTLACGVYIQLFINKSENAISSKQNLIELQELEKIESQDYIQISNISKNELNYSKAFRNQGFVLNLVMNIIAMTMLTYPYPILSLYLIKQFNLQVEIVGRYVFIQPLAYAIASIGLIYINKPNKKRFILYGQLIHSLSQFFFGPDALFTGIQKNLAIFCVAQFISGSAATPGIIYTLPSMTESLLEMYPIDEERATNISTAVYTVGICIGEFIGPLVSGSLNSLADYPRIASTFGITSLIIVAIYYRFMFMNVNKK